MTKRETANQRHKELVEALPELKQRLARDVGRMWKTATAVIQHKDQTADGAQIAAEPRRNYSRGRK